MHGLSRLAAFVVFISVVAVPAVAAAQPPGTWNSTGSMIKDRDLHTATVLADGRVLVVGGLSSTAPNFVTAERSAEFYDSRTGAWSVTGSLGITRWAHTATLLRDGRVLVTGGGSIFSCCLTASAELYDPSSGTWSVTAAMTTPRIGHTATLLDDGRVLVVGGLSALCDGCEEASAEIYDPSSSTWSPTGSMATPRTHHVAVLLRDGHVLVAGGFHVEQVGGVIVGGRLSVAERYDPRLGTWSPTGSMVTARELTTATLLQDGKVLVAGGYSGSAESSAELYDPATGVWSVTGMMATPRIQHIAVLLPSGKVLVAGGLNLNIFPGVFESSAEEYDPISGTWNITGRMMDARHRHTASLLKTGMALVSGGWGGGPLPLASAELYTPADQVQIPRPSFPVVLVHGTCSSSATWEPLKNSLLTVGWRFGGTLRPFANDLSEHAADSDFYLTELLDPVIGSGLEAWGIELKRYLDTINSFRTDRGLPRTSFIVVAHSAGGLAARTYLQSLLQLFPYENDIHHLITYGTPHLGTPGAARDLAQRFLATVGECSIFTPDEIASSRGIQQMVPGSNLLHLLNDQLFPGGVRHTSLIGIESNHECRFLLSGEDDCVVPAASQNIQNIHAPPPSGLVEVRETARRHDRQTTDVHNIVWAIGRGGIHGVDRLAINVASPVDIIVIDPQGRSVSTAFSSIPFASYEEIERSNGDRHDAVTIPFAAKGEYRVQVVPQPEALPTDVFSILVQRNSSRFLLADNVLVRDIPAEPFGFGIEETLHASIDIKPGSFPNAIDVRSRGKIPIALLSTPEFTASDTVSLVTFGRTGSEGSLAFCDAKGEDVNSDGLADLVCHFITELTGFQSGDTAGVLRGETVDGTLLTGSDSIRLVP